MPPTEPSQVISAIESLEAPILALDRTGAIRLMNDAAERWLGRSRQRSLGQRLEAIESHGAMLAAIARQVMAEERTVRANASSGEQAVAVSGSPWWEGDLIVGAVLLISFPRTIPEEQTHPDVAALAAGLAHEVRNPLAALRGAAELLTAELGDASVSVREYVDLILRETARVDALVSRLLTVGRPITLQRKATRGDEVLHDLAIQVRALAKARGVPITVEETYDPALPVLHVDRDRLFEALVNLAKNAVEALPLSGGRLTLTARLDPKRRRTATGSHPLVSLSICDTGPGLGAVRDRLFTPFFSTKPTGTGLGLLLARQIIEAHRGVLTLRDRPGPETGAEVDVLLPIEAMDG